MQIALLHLSCFHFCLAGGFFNATLASLVPITAYDQFLLLSFPLSLSVSCPSFWTGHRGQYAALQICGLHWFPEACTHPQREFGASWFLAGCGTSAEILRCVPFFSSYCWHGWDRRKPPSIWFVMTEILSSVSHPKERYLLVILGTLGLILYCPASCAVIYTMQCKCNVGVKCCHSS